MTATASALVSNWPTDVGPLGYALGIGLLIGLERGWTSRDDAPGTRVAGIRTFGILGLMGGTIGLLGGIAGAVLAASTGAILAIGYARQSARADALSATNALVCLLTLLLGALATSGRTIEALAFAAIATALLAMRETLHHWLRGMTEAEMRSAARFAVISLVILPLLPNQPMGPLGAWNPHQLWFLVVLVSGLSFLGYVAARRIGPTRGVIVTALCGAVVSSTAVTAALSKRLDAGEDASPPLIAGIVLASLVMLLRVLLLSAGLVPHALPTLGLILGPAIVIAGAAVFLAIRRCDTGAPGEAMPLGNPLELKAGIGLAALLGVASLASRWASLKMGDVGIAGVLAMTGIADVDAAILAMASLPHNTLDGTTAGIVLAIPILLNTLFKGGITLALARRKGLQAALPLFASAATAAVVLLALL